MEEFLRQMQGKSVKVKVICVGKHNSISRDGAVKMEEEHEVRDYCASE